ncbi:MAG: hypothetical protein U9P12_05205 [Verrucomicrobiota bacterium]|nr:hypothetical protein [Verrucomicrobiota bacterium]
MNKRAEKRCSGWFSFAVATYIAGVVAFVSWSHIRHRSALLGHIDKSLENGAYAACEIVGDNYAESLLLIGDTNAFAYKACQQRLGRFAKKGGFTAVGATARGKSGTYSLIAGSGDPDTMPEGDVKLGGSLPEDITSLMLKLSTAPGRGIATQAIDHPKYGRLRIAMLYKGRPGEGGIAFIAAQGVESVKKQLRKQTIHEVAAGLFLLVMAVPLVMLYNCSHQRASEELAELNARLQQDVEGRKNREEELKDAIHDLERFNAVSSGRESRIIELKAEVNELLKQTNRKARYNIDKTD